ncbi:hypothetical protein SDC9_147340 [bioreactor metagenome]|uniref:Uncharacterized protein n=1 Tax=bioreactor metagenome TaxID=1076179 RepID=A0A645EFF8_9ZZZZ
MRIENLGRSQKHGHMGIVPAGMHTPRVFGSKRQTGLLMYRQRIHIRPQGDDFAGLSTLDGGYQTGVLLEKAIGNAKFIELFAYIRTCHG